MTEKQLKELRQAFGRRLRESRKLAGLTQVELAKQLGVNRQAVGHWETGRNLPEGKTLRKLAEVLGVSAMWLHGNSLTQTTEPLITALRLCSPTVCARSLCPFYDMPCHECEEALRLAAADRLEELLSEKEANR